MRIVLSLLLTGVALAKDPIVLIPLEGEKRNVRGVQKRVLKALKNHDVRVSRRTMAELQDAAGCREDTPPCLGMIGREAGTSEFIYGSVFREDRRLSVLLRRFSVDDEVEVGRVQIQIRKPSSRNIGNLVSNLMKLSVEANVDVPPALAPSLGSLEVIAELPDVLIRVNGQPRGVAPLRLEDIGVATYDLEAEKAGYKIWRGQAAVEAGEVTTVRVALEILPQEQRAMAAADPSTLKTRTWIAGGAAAAILSAAAVFGVLTAAEQNDFDEAVGTLDAGDPTAAERARNLESDADSGANKALVANVLFAVGGAAAIATGVLAYMDLTGETEGSGAVSVQPGGMQIRF